MDDVHDSCGYFHDDPLEFVSDMLGHIFPISFPEHVFSFYSRRDCQEPLATPLNICVGNYEEEQD